MALFSKKDKYIRINPNRSVRENLKLSQRFQMNYSPSVQAVSIPSIRRIWEVSASAHIVAIPFVFLPKNAWL